MIVIYNLQFDNRKTFNVIRSAEVEIILSWFECHKAEV